jgi:hypothetical protein
MRFTLSGSRWGQHAGGVADPEVAGGLKAGEAH